MKNKGTKQKSKKKGGENAFGCDLTEHLQSSAQDGKLYLFNFYFYTSTLLQAAFITLDVTPFINYLTRV